MNTIVIVIVLSSIIAVPNLYSYQIIIKSQEILQKQNNL